MDDLWKIFLVGLYVLALAFLLTPVENVLEGSVALALVGAAIVGFSFHPGKEVYYVRTKRHVFGPNGDEQVEHDFIAVKVELVRLWVLFVPTVLAVSFLVLSSANGVLWDFSLMNWVFDSPFAAVMFQGVSVIHGIVVFVIVMLQAWVSERWVLRNSEASSTDSFRRRQWGVTYAFLDERGSMYGGDCMDFHLVPPSTLSTIVFYNPQNPDVNKIAMAFLFHRLVVLGRGVTDLNMQTVEAQEALAEIRSRRLAPDET
jgi:uncharacterized integral membrane protein